MAYSIDVDLTYFLSTWGAPMLKGLYMELPS